MMIEAIVDAKYYWDNRYYEKVGSEVKDITDELPFEIPEGYNERIPVFKSLWEPHYSARHFTAIKELCPQIRLEPESCLSTFFSPPFCKEFP